MTCHWVQSDTNRLNNTGTGKWSLAQAEDLNPSTVKDAVLCHNSRADETTSFLRSNLPTRSAPAWGELPDVLEQGVQSNGQRVLLPVLDPLYHGLVMEDADW